MNEKISTQLPPRGTFWKWLALNGVLLASYLAFFHCCLIIDFPDSLPVGLAFAGFTAALCWRFRRLFLNAYELLFYFAIPLDIFLESLIPYHSGYSFYWCAAAFWLVFGGYRVYYSTGSSAADLAPPLVTSETIAPSIGPAEYET